jgi:hypothetical protein
MMFGREGVILALLNHESAALQAAFLSLVTS